MSSLPTIHFLIKSNSALGRETNKEIEAIKTHNPNLKIKTFDFLKTRVIENNDRYKHYSDNFSSNFSNSILVQLNSLKKLLSDTETQILVVCCLEWYVFLYFCKAEVSSYETKMKNNELVNRFSNIYHFAQSGKFDRQFIAGDLKLIYFWNKYQTFHISTLRTEYNMLVQLKSLGPNLKLNHSENPNGNNKRKESERLEKRKNEIKKLKEALPLSMIKNFAEIVPIGHGKKPRLVCLHFSLLAEGILIIGKLFSDSHFKDAKPKFETCYLVIAYNLANTMVLADTHSVLETESNPAIEKKRYFNNYLNNAGRSQKLIGFFRRIKRMGEEKSRKLWRKKPNLLRQGR